MGHRRIITPLAAFVMAFVIAGSVGVHAQEISGNDGADDIDSPTSSAPAACPPGASCIIAAPGPSGGQFRGRLRIQTDANRYFDGDTVTIDFLTPYPGQYQIIDYSPNGRQTVVFAGYSNGQDGDEVYGQVAAPFGRECLRLRFRLDSGQTISTRVCFNTSR